MTEQAWLIIILGGCALLALFGGLWLRLYRRTRRAGATELGQATLQEAKSPKAR